MPYKSRDAEVIHAMQRRQRRWHGPVLDLLWRKPWRSAAPPAVSRRHPMRVNLSNLWGWLRNAHDCTDPSIGCSCYGGFRFPRERAVCVAVFGWLHGPDCYVVKVRPDPQSWHHPCGAPWCTCPPGLPRLTKDD